MSTSKIVWYIMGILTILATILFFMGIPERLAVLPPDQHPKLIYGSILFGVVLGTIIVTCFFPRVHTVSLRIIGAISMACCVFNLIDSFRTRNFSQFPLTLSLWLPGSIYLVVKGKMDY